jgi:hypothetical protein
MSKLSDLLSTREITAFQENLPKGKIFSVSGMPSGMFACVRADHQWCWNSPGCGIAVIEMWGASGTVGCNCCCTQSIPSNTGAYTKKTIAVFPDSVILGRPGVPCNGPGISGWLNNACISEGSCLVWYGARDLCGHTNGCMCAMGGLGGKHYCACSTNLLSPFCCFIRESYYYTEIGFAGCGIICNVCCDEATRNTRCACGYGGDVNKCGIFGKMEFRGCQTSCVCLFIQHVPFAPGVFSEEGGWMAYSWANDHGGEQWSGSGQAGVGMMMNYTSKSPGGGQPWTACWRGDRFCNCYEMSGCQTFMPYGIASTAAIACPGVRDVGRRGGPGAIRVTYRGSGVNEDQQHTCLGGM